MLDNTLSPPAVIRRLNFSSPEGESKPSRKQRRKLINDAQTELVSYVYIATYMLQLDNYMWKFVCIKHSYVCIR